MNLGTCNELFLPLLTLILSIIRVNSFEVNIGDSGQVKIQQGSSVVLKCQGSKSYEFCIWSHGPNQCKFEWKFLSGKIKRTYCSSYFTRRLQFVGDYSKHECSVKLTNSHK